MLQIRWHRKDFDLNPYRGLTITTTKLHTSMSLEPSWPLSVDGCSPGDHDTLVNGQWWPNFMAALRDGAHNATRAGISGCSLNGAYSVVISGGGGNQYDDVDQGEEIDYCGTAGTEGEMKEGTMMLVTSMQRSTPVCILRNHSASKKSQYAPPSGRIRYDGLYRVQSMTQINAQFEEYKFHLVRLPNQGPIRWSGPGKKPNDQKISKYAPDTSR